MDRKYIILTEGLTNPHVAKTARNLIYYKPESVLAIYDTTQKGKNSKDLLGVGNHPVIDSFDIMDGADSLLIGVATAGGKLPSTYKPIILEAISKGLNIVSGGHDYLSSYDDLTVAANKNNVKIIDIRKNDERDVAHRKGIDESTLRIHTVGNDCSLGKMITSLEIHNNLVKRGYDSAFVATGQTGILIAGDGCPVDAVVGDYINGAAEKLVLKNQHHKILNIEGQGSLVHPRYSAVTLGLLHGCMPDGLIMCYEMGREYIYGMDGIKISPLEEVIELYDKMANVMNPCKIIGIAINSRKNTKEEAETERERIKEKFGLHVCDVIKHGADELADAVIHLARITGKGGI